MKLVTIAFSALIPIFSFAAEPIQLQPGGCVEISGQKVCASGSPSQCVVRLNYNSFEKYQIYIGDSMVDAAGTNEGLQNVLYRLQQAGRCQGMQVRHD